MMLWPMKGALEMDTKDRFKMYFRSNTKGLANGLDVEMREEKQE